MKSALSSLTTEFHILGSGSIGLLLGAKLRKALSKEQVTLFLRPYNQQFLHTNIAAIPFTKYYYTIIEFIEFETNIEKYFTHKVEISAKLLDLQDRSKVTNIVLCTKANDAVSALESVNNLSKDEDLNVFIMSNGALAIQHELRLRKMKINIFPCTLTHGAYQLPTLDKSSFRRVKHAGFGSVYTTHTSFNSLLNTCNLNSHLVSEEEMQLILWKKLAANCVINPLSCIYNCENGKVSHYQEIMTKIIKEVSLVAQKTLTSKLSEEMLTDFVNVVIKDTRKNRSSMYQDLMMKRSSKTEIDFLNGYIVQLGKKYNVYTPMNEELCRHIYKLESMNFKNF